jgi:hypothetical protein
MPWTRASKATLALCVGLYAFHLFQVWRNVVDLPVADEWEIFNPDQLPAGLTPGWLFAQHNEHRMATYKLSVWALYHVGGWDVAVHQVLNFLLYGAAVALIFLVARRAAPEAPPWLVLGFNIFLLTTAGIQNHVMAIQCAFHFWLIFFLLSARLLFDAAQSTRALAAGCIFSALSVFSLASGVVSSVVLLLAFAAFKLSRAFRAEEGGARGAELFQLLFVAVSVVGSVALWLYGYRKPPQHPPLASPLGAEFWDYFLNAVSFCFGFESLSGAVGLVCLLVVLTPVCVLLWKKRGDLTAGQWTMFSAVACALAVLASIAAGRGEFGAAQSKTSRYAEFGMALAPFAAVSWWALLKGREGPRAALLAALWLSLFLAFLNDWRFRDYRVERAARLKGVECVRDYYRHGGEGLCPTIYPTPLGPRLDAARKLDAAFYRDLELPPEGR